MLHDALRWVYYIQHLPLTYLAPVPSTSYDNKVIMEQPPSPTAHEVDLKAFAKLTVKTFERLAPFSQLQAMCVSVFSESGFLLRSLNIN